jgi:uncharacterized iron-regulated membrane protein
MSEARLYRAAWRWHFYAGLFVLPFVLVLSVTGAIYLFKPQIDRWEEGTYRHLGTTDAVSADAQLAAVEAAYPGAQFNSYRLPAVAGDAALIEIVDGGQVREVFASPQGAVLGVLDRDTRISETVARIHGTLLLGAWGDRLVELAASWTIVLIVTGLILWWPRPFRAAGTFWPRLSLRGRPLLKDVHRTVGFWISGLVLIMLVSGLPWAGTWGSAFAWVRSEFGLVQGVQDWKIGEVRPAEPHHSDMAMPVTAASQPNSLPLSVFVAKAEAERMAFPVIVVPPHAPQRFGPPNGPVWTVKSEAQNRPLARQVSFDPETGREVERSGWSDKHVLDRIVNIGVAWHEGQLFGVPNQILGLLTALSLVAISMLGVVMWLKRRPAGTIGAPPSMDGAAPRWLLIVLVAGGLLLPLFGLSLILLALVDLCVRRRVRIA